MIRGIEDRHWEKMIVHLCGVSNADPEKGVVPEIHATMAEKQPCVGRIS